MNGSCKNLTCRSTPLINQNNNLIVLERTNAIREYLAQWRSITFGVNNNTNKVQANVTYDTGWVNCTFALNGVFKVAEGSVCQVRRIGKVVHVRGTVESKEDYPLINWQDYIGTCILPDEKFYPSKNESFVAQASRKQRCAARVQTGGGITVGRFTDANSSGAYTIYQGLMVNLGFTYFVD